MAASMLLVLRRVGHYLTNVENRLLCLLLGGRNDGGEYGYEPALIQDVKWRTENRPSEFNSQSIIGEIVGNGFLWAVQRNRRSLERRHMRLRCPEKQIKRKNNLKMCNTCGHFHEFHTICGNCYEKVRAETEAIQERIESEWKLDEVDKDVVVVYDNDEKKETEFWNGRRIVEMKRERPPWFHNNLRMPTRNPSKGTSSKELANTIISQIK